MKKIKLQAHRGVSSDCPENTMAAFRCAVMQGYDVIELDLQYTKDRRIVALHDRLINRTARNQDNAPPEKDIMICEITYDEALQYNFGSFLSNRYHAERIPLFKEVLKFAKNNGIRLKIDNQIQKFPEEILSRFFEEICGYAQYVSITVNNIEFAERCLREIPGIGIDYDGEVTENILVVLSRMVPRERLTVWLPYKCEYTSWVQIPFADEKKSEMIKKYAKLGLWLLNDYNSFFEAAERFRPDIVETNGTVKPIKNVNSRYDMHTHSEYSHDSECKMSDMADMAKKVGLCGFAVTDHCDIFLCETQDIVGAAKGSVDGAFKMNSKTDITVLRGIEIGEAIWNKNMAERILNDIDFDVVIGSVHAVKFDGSQPYSKIDFSKMGKDTTEQYLNQYFNDVAELIECCDIDILAHLTCPLRYINGKYNMGIDCRQYEKKIKDILKSITERRIALEINTSCVYEGSKYCEFMPEKWIIQMYHDMGGYLVTTGSDAHIAEKSANAFDALYEFLREQGFKNVYYYKDRYPIQCTIKQDMARI